MLIFFAFFSGFRKDLFKKQKQKNKQTNKKKQMADYSLTYPGHSEVRISADWQFHSLFFCMISVSEKKTEAVIMNYYKNSSF